MNLWTSLYIINIDTLNQLVRDYGKDISIVMWIGKTQNTSDVSTPCS